MGKKDYQKEHTKDLLDDYVIGRLQSHGQTFEILIEPDAVEKFRTGTEVELLEKMPAEKVFSDAIKGKRAPDHMIERAFETEDVEEITKKILEDGEVQLTTEQRNKRQEQKRKEIIDRIARRSYNPQTNTPHPPNRIENAIEEANIHIDPFKPVSQQMDEIVDQLRELLPLSFEKKNFSVTLRGELQGKIYGRLKNMGNIKEQEWLNDGRWQAIVEIPGGIQDEFYEKINDLTKGKAEIEELD